MKQQNILIDKIDFLFNKCHMLLIHSELSLK